MRKIVIILYGPPGSGKGTQANLLAQKMGLIHFDTGKYLESVVHDPRRQKEAFIRRERKMFDEGILLTPSFVLREVSEAATKIAKAGLGMVFSGSPRTIYEAEGLVPILERLYGKNNIFVFELKLPAKGSIKRNSARLVCRECGYGLLTAYYPKVHHVRYGKLSHVVKAKYCPVCGGRLYRRTLDKPEVIKVRLHEYENRTKPIFDILRKRRYVLEPINASLAPYKVLGKIAGTIMLRSKGIGKKVYATTTSAQTLDFYRILFS
ncbi:MAG: nucleoside monophosphate kinase [Patescibacteria group bacterium]